MTEPYSEADARQQIIDHRLRLAGWDRGRQLAGDSGAGHFSSDRANVVLLAGGLRYAATTLRTAVSRRGDDIWHANAGLWRGVRGALHNEAHRARDLRGANALIAEEFYYFGREAIVVPERFGSMLATTQGHKNTHDAALIDRFWAWVSARAPWIGRIGQSTEFTDAGCRAQRADTDDDDENCCPRAPYPSNYGG